MVRLRKNIQVGVTRIPQNSTTIAYIVYENSTIFKKNLKFPQALLLNHIIHPIYIV